MSKLLQKQKGFTIIELLIATVVFSVVLLIASTAVIQIGRLYHKGIISSRTQETTRSVMSTVSQDLQFSDSNSFKQNYSALGSNAPANPAENPPLTPTAEGQALAVCIGSSRYTYWLGQPVTAGVHGLLLDQADAGCTPNSGSGTELLGENMRLTEFRVARGSAGMYEVHVKIAYGYKDLLTTYSEATGNLDLANLPSTSCRSGIAGSNFCAVSMLDTTVKRRIE